jgi:hypothetical protein
VVISEIVWEVVRMSVFKSSVFLLLQILLLAGIDDKGLATGQRRGQLVEERKPTVPNRGTKMTSSILYNRLLTPEDMQEYVSPSLIRRTRIRPARLQIDRDITKGVQRLLRIPLLPPSQLPPTQSYYVQTTATTDLYRSSLNADIAYFLSDGTNVIGFVIPSLQYNTTALCFGIEAAEISPSGLNRPLNEYREINKRPTVERTRKVDRDDDDDEDYDDDDREGYGVRVSNLREEMRAEVNQTTLLFKPGREWGSCSAVEYSTFINAVEYTKSIDPSRGLFFDVYISGNTQSISLLYLQIKLVRETSLL